MQDRANVPRWLAFRDGYCPSNLSWRIAPSFEQPFGVTTALSRSPLLHSAWRGWRRAVCRVCPDPPDPFLVGHSGVLNSFFGALPPGAPGVYPRSGMGCEYPCEGTPNRSGLTPSAGPAVRSWNGVTALIYAAIDDERAIVAALLGARADVDAKHNDGCAFAAVLPGAWSAVTDGAPMQPCPPRPAGRQRCTMRRPTGASAPARSCSSAAPISASQTTTGNAVPPTATPTAAHPIGAGERLANSHKHATSSASTTRRWRRRGRRIGAAASRAPAACAPLGCLPHRRARHARHACTRAAQHAEAAFFGARRHNRGMMCASHCARSAAVVGRQKAGRIHTVLPPTVQGGASRTHGHVACDAQRVWLRVRSAVSREWWYRPNSCARRRPRCVRSVRPLTPVLESTMRPLWPKYSSHACVHSAHSALIRL